MKQRSIQIFKDKWTAAQLAPHVTKSNSAIAQAMKLMKDAERDPAKKE